MSAAIKEDAATPEADAKAPIGDKTADVKSEETKDAKAPKDAAAEVTDKKDAQDPKEAEQTDGEKPGEFDTLKFEIPEGTEINEAWMDKLVSAEPIKKLSQTEVNGLIGMVGEFVKDLETQREEAHAAKVQGWRDDFEKNEYVVKNGGSKALLPFALAARDEYFPDLLDELNATGLGDHSSMLVGFARIAKDRGLLESQIEGGGRPPGGSEKGNAAHKLFPDHAPGGKYDR